MKYHGYFNPKIEPCLSDTEREAINKMLEKSIQQLSKQGIIQTPNSEASVTVSFDWPLRKAPGLDFNSYYATNNFVDHDTGPGLLDYDCNSRTYNGHRGTDYDTWPFPWYIYENDFVEVIAAEAGTIILKQDGNDDDHCGCSGS